jgi:predicted ABC-type ATPase
LVNEGKDIFILGGPNGAGKTTAARVLLPQKLPIDAFVNADEIVRRISPDNVDSAALLAGRLMIARMRELVRTGESFAFETTCAAKTYIRMLQDC